MKSRLVSPSLSLRTLEPPYRRDWSRQNEERGAPLPRSSPNFGPGMAFRVDLTPRAQQDLNRIYAGVIREAQYRGLRWCDRFEQSMLSLSSLAERCPVEPRLSSSRRTVRKLLFGKRRHVYRVYYAIYDGVVRVLHVRHGARKEPRRI